jgi:DNA-directed RNA polymerase subunit omega
MIEDIQSGMIADEMGGRFRLTALIQKRWRQLMQGARPTVEHKGRTPIEVVVEEISEKNVVLLEEAEQDEAIEIES